jgi:hypothetical protein
VKEFTEAALARLSAGRTRGRLKFSLKTVVRSDYGWDTKALDSRGAIPLKVLKSKRLNHVGINTQFVPIAGNVRLAHIMYIPTFDLIRTYHGPPSELGDA